MKEGKEGSGEEHAAPEEDENEFEGHDHREDGAHDAQHQQEARLLGVRPQREVVHLLGERQTEIGGEENQRGA